MSIGPTTPPEDVDLTEDTAENRRGAAYAGVPIIEWEVRGIHDDNGDRLPPATLRKSPPEFTIMYGGETVVTLRLTQRSTAAIQAALTEAQHALAGTSPEQPKSLRDRFMSLVDWCWAHKIRGGFLALITLSMVYSVIAGAFTLA